MKNSKRLWKKLFYPIKESRAILFQSLITFLLIGAILFTKSFITNLTNQKYNYLSDTSFMEEDWENYTLNNLPELIEIQNEKLKKYQSILQDPLMKSDCIYNASFHMKSDSSKSIGRYNFFISSFLKEAFHYTSTEEFNTEVINGAKGLYISSKLALEEKIQIGDFVTIYKDNYFNSSFRYQVVGIFQTQNEDIEYRIYCDEDLFSKVDLDKENTKFSIQYLFIGSKSIDTLQLKAIAMNSNHTFHSKGIFISEERDTFNNFFKVADVYLYLSTGIMGLSLFLLLIIKGIKSKEEYFIENIYYKKNSTVLFHLLFKNFILVCFGLIVSTFILLLCSLIFLAIFKFYFFITLEYLIITLIEYLILFIGSITSFLLFKKHKISFKDI